MKYKFQVMVALTYKDEDIEVEIDLSDEEVETIKSLITVYESKKEEPADLEEYVPPTDLLQILEDNDKKLFDKFWWDTIYPHVFIKMLVSRNMMKTISITTTKTTSMTYRTCTATTSNLSTPAAASARFLQIGNSNNLRCHHPRRIAPRSPHRGLAQICYDLSSLKTEKREIDAIREPHFSQSQYSEQPFTMRWRKLKR